MTEALAIGRQEHLTFKGNLRQTRYGWLRLTPAYSVHLVADLLDRHKPASVLDPYCGTGTTALVCAEKGIPSCTTDINPFLVWLAGAKSACYSAHELEAFREAASDVGEAISAIGEPAEWVPPLHQIEKWWEPAVLHALGRGMAAIKARTESLPRGAVDLLQIVFCRTLIERACVSFGHQSMSFRQRKEQESLLDDEYLTDLVAATWKTTAGAIATSASSVIEEPPRVELCDARDLTRCFQGQRFDCVITSPPYPNRMSYIRELRPYMFWLGYLSDGRAAGEMDWQAIGGTWGCATSKVGHWSPDVLREIPHENFGQILEGIAEQSDLLSRYVHKYFFDMVDHFRSLANVVAPGGRVHYIVGNSKFYEVMLPVEQIYAGMLSEAGFDGVRVETLRKRSSKRELYEFLVSGQRSADPSE